MQNNKIINFNNTDFINNIKNEISKHLNKIIQSIQIILKNTLYNLLLYIFILTCNKLTILDGCM